MVVITTATQETTRHAMNDAMPYWKFNARFTSVT